MNAISQISSEMSAALALDLAANIWPEADVFKNHNVDPLYGAALLQQDWFRKMVDEARREWSSISNAKQRIRLKSQLAVEHSIEELYAVVTDKQTPAAARVAAFKELKDLSGAAQGDGDSGGGGPQAPTVNIFLNGEESPAISITSGKRTSSQDVLDTEPLEVMEAEEVTPSNLDIGMAPL